VAFSVAAKKVSKNNNKRRCGYALPRGACFGGNATLIGASANVMVASYARRAGHPISFIKYLLHGLPLTILTVMIGMGYLMLVYFV
jgi:Na+/H+ antiporter NhaD/arsenite permease-like protein